MNPSQRPYLSMILLVALVAISWWFGRPASSPPVHSATTLTTLIPQSQGSVRGAQVDNMPPTSHWEVAPTSAGQGSVLTGETSDLGAGVSRVVVQLQRKSDNAVWDGKKWQLLAGATTDAVVHGRNFLYTINTPLIIGESYILRSQAIDATGNAQTNWSEIQVSGVDKGASALR